MSDDDLDRCAAIAGAALGYGDLDAAIADVHLLPGRPEVRALLAAGLVEVLLRESRSLDLRRLRELDGLLTLASAAPPPGPKWLRIKATARVLAMLREAAELEQKDARAALAELDTLERDAAGDEGLLNLIVVARQALRFGAAISEDNSGEIVTRLPEAFTSLGANLPPGAAPDGYRRVGTAAADLLAAVHRGEPLGEHLARFQEVSGDLPQGDPLRAAVADAAGSMTAFLPLMGDPDAVVSDADLAALEERTSRTDLSRPERALAWAAAGGAALGHGGEFRPDRLEKGVRYFRRALETAGDDDPQLVFHLTGLAMGLYRRGQVSNAVADLREACAVLERARRLAGGPHHPQWSMINGMLTDVRQQVDAGPEFHREGLEGLRAYVWRVLLQPDLAGAAAAVRQAAEDALGIARQCLIANDPAAAMTALDAGRGLALFAATGLRTVGDHLARAGEHELAGRWRAAAATGDPDRLPGDLRRDVLTVLSRHSSAAALLDPPGYDEVQRALGTLDADALVYLMPADGHVTGYAVVTPAAGPPAYLVLPALTVSDVAEHLDALATGDAREVDGARGAEPVRDMGESTAEPELADGVAKLCDWAWRAVMGPLLETYLPRLPEPAGRPRRVVLIPIGDLARVPWQAARRPDGAYAVQLAAVSQAVSARMLCWSAGLSPVPPGPAGLVVGDPDPKLAVPGLTAARLEAYGIRQAFYRSARYVGRFPTGNPSSSGAGTAAEVRRWLTDPGPAAGTMLHLACHGFVRPGTRTPTAYLLLAGGTLTAEELAALMASAPEREIALVVLAACHTGRAINGYDEAFSLGTAFLAGGARTVLGTQWAVPDRATSVLMFMFHHFLRAGGLPAWAALREAQLWALNGGRPIPPDMPEPLRRQLAGAEPESVVAWAAFVHWGQ